MSNRERRDLYWRRYMSELKRHGMDAPESNTAYTLYVQALKVYYKEVGRDYG